MKTSFRLLVGAAVAVLVIALVASLDLSSRGAELSDPPGTDVSQALSPHTPPMEKSTPPASDQPLADPHGIGECPKQHSPVLRRGLDSSGQPTWWHADGSTTTRVKQGYTTPEGEPRLIARIVIIRPAEALPDPAK